MKKPSLIIIFLILFPISSFADITTGLVGWWKLNDGSGTSALDSSGDGYTGALLNSPTWVTGKIWSYGLNFLYTSSQYVDTTGYSGITGTGPWTFSAWFNTADTRGSQSNPLCGWGYGGSSAGSGAQVSIESGVIWERSLLGQTADWGSGYNNGSWHLVVVTFAGGGTTSLMNAYVDGVLLTGSYSGSTNINIVANGDFTIAHQSAINSGSNQYFNGNIDDVRLYNRALSQADVTELYNYTGQSVSTFHTNILNKAILRNAIIN